MATSKLAWQTLSADDQNLPKELREAIAQYEMARDTVEELVKKSKPAAKGKRWVFTWRYGVGVALADSNGGNTNYFAS